MTRSASPPRAVIGMTLHNNAGYLREAAESLLAQSCTDFALVMLDDGSTDATETIARAIERGDPRVRYIRRDRRRGMVATWREVVDLGYRHYPGAEYFAWASDHDRWHPEWLRRLVNELDAHSAVVLAYPLCARIDESGDRREKEPRRFDTRGAVGRDDRWSRFCRRGTGSGDMVYGLMRMAALRRAGVFRPVLRPDRLLMAELTLQGEISQVPEILWFRRESGGASVARQQRTLFAGAPPRWLWLPPWIQHGWVLLRQYGWASASDGMAAVSVVRMVALYEVTYIWRSIRRSESWHRVLRAADVPQTVRKHLRRSCRHAVNWTATMARRAQGVARRQGRRAVYESGVTMQRLRGRLRRASRRGIYDVLVLTHRLGLRGGGKQER